MPTKYQFGGLGHLFVCPCGCSEFIRAEGVKQSVLPPRAGKGVLCLKQK